MILPQPTKRQTTHGDIGLKMKSPQRTANKYMLGGGAGGAGAGGGRGEDK